MAYLQLAGLYLTSSGRTNCRWCYTAGVRGLDGQVISPTVWRDLPLAIARLKVERAARKHYREQHPDVTLPR